MTEKNINLAISSSPHAHSGASVRGIMLTVIIALTPALLWGFWMFGWPAVVLTATCVAACVGAEALSRRLMKRNLGIGDGSAVVTGILLAMCLPPSLPLFMAVIGAVVAIVLAKQVFGGLGYNPFNPALVGRVFLTISFPFAMIQWTAPGPSPTDDTHAVTAATPLAAWETEWSGQENTAGFFEEFPLVNLFFGNQAGSFGEVSAFLLMLGGLFLIWRRCVHWQTPVFYLGTVTLISVILYGIDSQRYLSPAYHLFSGGLMLGAWFMATDMVTSPVTSRGMMVFGAGCGVLTMVIRVWGGYPEGVSFAILLMNAAVPLINRYTRPRVFGVSKS